MEEAKGPAHRARGLGKLMNPTGMFLGWEGGLHADLPEGTPGSGDVGLMRRLATRRMLLMIDAW